MLGRLRAAAGETRAALRRFLLFLRAFAGARRLRAELIGEIPGRRVIIFPPTLDWHLPLYQRPQQLARAYSEKKNTLVLYLTANAAHDRVVVTEKLSETLYLVNASLAHALVPLLRGAAETVLSLSWTANRRYVELLRPDALIYEYIDELEIFDGYGEAMRREHLYLLRRADLTVCTAQTLYEKALPYARKAILSPNAGDYALFSRCAAAAPAPEAAELAARFSCTLGYYGALAGWFDYALIASVADARPDWLILLVGMDYDATLRLFDIALIPFVLNEITRSTSPVKLFEYMAAEKPILCSRMPECLRYESVETYSDVRDFLEKAETLLRRRDDPAFRSVLRREALENTWEARTDEILTALETAKRAESLPFSVHAEKKAVSG